MSKFWEKITKNIKSKKQEELKKIKFNNSYSDILINLANPSLIKYPQNTSLGMQTSTPKEIMTFNPNLLSLLYLTNPIVSSVINRPVQDALKDGINLDCQDLGQETNRFLKALDEEDFFVTLKELFFWARLFGGSAILINQESVDPLLPFSLSQVKKGCRLELYALNRWQINQGFQSGKYSLKENEFWKLDNQDIHSSRFVCVKNKAVPSFYKGQYGNWGTSEIDRMMREMEFYLKSQDVIFELADEAKIDIFSIEGLNEAFLFDPSKAQGILKRLEQSAQTKNFLNAIFMDKQDEYSSKSINFSGIKDIKNDASVGISIASQIPQDYWSGTGSSGFSSGEDVIERYNSMVESEVRRDLKKVINKLLPIKMLQYYGRTFDFSVSFPSLRTLNTKDEEEIKASKTNRIINLFEKGLLDEEDAKEFIKKNSLIG